MTPNGLQRGRSSLSIHHGPPAAALTDPKAVEGKLLQILRQAG